MERTHPATTLSDSLEPAHDRDARLLARVDVVGNPPRGELRAVSEASPENVFRVTESFWEFGLGHEAHTRAVQRRHAAFAPRDDVQRHDWSQSQPHETSEVSTVVEPR